LVVTEIQGPTKSWCTAGAKWLRT